MVKKLLMMLMMAVFAVITAMGQESFYVVMKDGSAEKFPVEKVDSLTFDNVEVDKVMGLGDLMKMVNALKNENKALKEENLRNKLIGRWKCVTEVDMMFMYSDVINFTEDKLIGMPYELDGDTIIQDRIKIPVNKLIGDSLVITVEGTGAVRYVRVDTRDENMRAKIEALNTRLDFVQEMSCDKMKKEHEALYAKIDSLELALKSLNTTTAALNTKSDFLLDKVLDYSFVDLGLESGTLWATYNVGATKPEGYGNYFAWGETMPKDKFAKEDGKWYGVEYSKLKSQGVIDANGNLTAKYDAASANWGNDWRMPTKAEIEELSKLTNKKAEINGVKGRIFIGTNGNVIFLPFAGGRLEGEAGSAGEYGFYWSATASENKDLADDLYMLSSDAYRRTSNRSNGFTVRPVLRTK